MARTGATSTVAEANALAVQQIAIERLLATLLAPQTGAERARTAGRLDAGPREGHGTAEIEEASQHQPAPVVARPQVTHVPRAEPAAPPATKEAPAPEAAPTIQVTIGRVEVRATPPPAPAPQRPRAKPPVMSLDEYLRQRNRGGQR